MTNHQLSPKASYSHSHKFVMNQGLSKQKPAHKVLVSQDFKMRGCESNEFSPKNSLIESNVYRDKNLVRKAGSYEASDFNFMSSQQGGAPKAVKNIFQQENQGQSEIEAKTISSMLSGKVSHKSKNLSHTNSMVEICPAMAQTNENISIEKKLN